MADAVANALSRRSAIEQEISLLTREMEEISTFLALHEKFSGTKTESRWAEKEQTVSRAADGYEPAPERKRGRPSDFADIMERVLNDLGHPLGRPEMVVELEKRGVAIPSEDKPRYLGTILWRHRDRFRNLPGNGYWLRLKPYAPANYDPTKDTDIGRLLESEPGFAEPPEKDWADMTDAEKTKIVMGDD